jgi:hypothetical protein
MLDKVPVTQESLFDHKLEQNKTNPKERRTTLKAGLPTNMLMNPIQIKSDNAEDKIDPRNNQDLR